MKWRIVLAAVSLGMGTAAFAQDRDRDPDRDRNPNRDRDRVRREIEVDDDEDLDARSFSVLLGSDTGFNDRPATLRLGVQGEGRMLGGEVASLSAVLPITYMTAGQEEFGLSTRQSVLEVPPSLRLRMFSMLPVRPYADAGIGLAFATRDEDNWLLEDHEASAGWMTRGALGVEIGESDGLMVVLEPSIQTYHLGGSYARFAGMFGIGSRF